MTVRLGGRQRSTGGPGGAGPSTSPLAALAVAAALAVLGPASVGGAAGARPPFVTATVPLNQTVRSLVRGRFSQTVTCRASCRVIARVFITPSDARKLGFRDVQAGRPFAIGLRQSRLTAGRATRLRVPLGREARRRLERWKRPLGLTGETFASSRTSRDRGLANWITTLRR